MYPRPVPTPITPSLEQRWTDEVHYLHSLWHQGPPSNPNPNHNSNPPIPIVPPHPVKNSPPPPVKKSKPKKKNIPNIVGVVEWPCNPLPDPNLQTSWPEPVQPGSAAVVVSDEEKAKMLALQLQQKGLKACQAFLTRNGAEGEDEVMEDSDDSDGSEGEEGDEGKEGEVEFFLEFFKEDKELREYYEKNMEGGEFMCLVCSGIGQKVGKRFKNCVALVQHSISISNTKRMSAHRAYGQAICRVLGWNVNRLPSIVLSLEEPLGGRLVNAEVKENNNHAEKSGAKTNTTGCDQNGSNRVDDIVDLEKEEQTGTFEKNAGVGMDNAVGQIEIDADELYKDI